ncbi:S8 family serine peptidase [Plantactinospora sp. GCM10030261]|uniref:S8 family serine peptidase n=1 Tax=Plantactinospora sp. GCM10030261 TaxID=3273420 RepID=UPI00362266DB
MARPSRRRDNRRRTLLGTGILVLSVVLAPTASPATAAPAVAALPVPPPPSVAGPAGPKPTPLAVAEALVAGFGAGATVDNSSVTRCMDAPAMPLAYRTDRIILRPAPTTTTATALAQVAAALTTEMGPGTFTIGTPETITWDPAADPGSVAGAARLPTGGSDDPGPDGPIWRVVSVPVHATNGEAVPVVKVARRLRAAGLTASPDYLLGSGNGPLGVWPNGAPAPTVGPGIPRAGLGGGTTVAVFDTGVPDAGLATLPSNLTRLTAADTEQPDRDGDGLADLYFAIHLVAISGMFATIAPDATVLGVRVTGPTGIATDFTAAKRMSTTLRNANDLDRWPQTIVNSFGSPTCGASPTGGGDDMVPLGLEMVAEAVDRHEQAVVVAAAGNMGSDVPFYPAAFQTEFPAVISVGALDATTDPDGDPWTSASRTATPASFSNFGETVTAWAPGVALPTYHANGLRFEPTGPKIPGYATVSGTSFAAPIVAAEIVEQIARTGQTPHQAWQAVRAAGRPCSAAVGSGVAVALPAMTATSTTRADPLLKTEC